MTGIRRIGQTSEKIIRAIERVLLRVCMALLMIMALLGAGDVAGRYLFNHPITGTLEISRLMMGGIIFLAWAYVMSEKGHVTVDILFNHFPARVKAILSFLMLPLTFFVFGLIAWQNVKIAMSNWESGELLMILDIPVAPLKLLVTLGAGLFCLECIIQMILSFKTIFVSEEQ